MLYSEQPPPPSREVSMKVKKLPPLKKRHTKPCKFFQFGRCSNTAEECNFAHVLVLPGLSSPLPVAMSPTVGAGGFYRYLVVGRCPSERTHGVQHICDVNEFGAQMNHMHLGPSSPLSPTPFAGTLAYPSPYVPYLPCYNLPWPQGTWVEQPFTTTIVNDRHAPSGRNNHASETESPSISFSTSTDSSALSLSDTPTDSGLVEALRSANIDKTGTSHLVSKASVIDVHPLHDYDESTIITGNLQSSKYTQNQQQAQIRAIDREHNSVISGYELHGSYPMSQVPSWYTMGNSYLSQVTGSNNGNTKTNTWSKSATRKYRTKPCRYFSAENECPNGDNCTFIHDTSIFPASPIIQNCLKGQNSSGNGGDSLMGCDKNNENAEKGISQAIDAESEGNKEKNFFPVTWRVIGGGVLMGGKRSENSGGEKQCCVESPEEPMTSKEPPIESSGGEDFDRKSCLTAPRLQSGTASTLHIARPQTVIGIRRCRDNLFPAESA